MSRRSFRSVERDSRVEKAVAEQAGLLLCTYAGLSYSEHTARHLSDRILSGRWDELSRETSLRLRSYPLVQLTKLAQDVLGA